MLIVLNHKMNLTIDEIKEYEKSLRDYDVIVMPQTPYMGLFTNGKYTLGSQCVSEYNATGGVSSEALHGLNVKYCLVGHGERRVANKDTDEVILDKVRELLIYNITPILCIGETLEEKSSNKVREVLTSQLDLVFNNIDIQNIIIAYEPIWVIGGTNELEINNIKERITFVKKHLNDKYQKNVLVLYGGGISPDNISELKEIKNLDGMLIGSASLSIDNIKKIAKIIKI